MKLKLNLDKASLQEFFLEHVEKFVFGGIVLCFLALVYGAAVRETFEKEPQELLDATTNANNHIARTTPDQSGIEPPPDYTRRVEESDHPVEAVAYAFGQPFDPPPGKQDKLSMPPFLPVVMLRGTADRGSISAGGGTGGSSGSGPVVGRRWAVLTAVVPYRDQRNAYREDFASADYQPPQGDMPAYVWCRVERADVTHGTPAGGLQWAPVDVAAAWQRVGGWAGDKGQLIPQEFIHERITMPLPPRVDEDWGAEVAHEEIVGPPFEAVWRNPEAHRGKEVTWQGMQNSVDKSRNRVVFVWGVQSGVAMEEEPKYFAVDYATSDQVSAVGRGGTITGIVQGQTQITINRQDPNTGAVTAVPLFVPLLKPVTDGQTAEPAGGVIDPFGGGVGLEEEPGATGRQPRQEEEDGEPDMLLFRFFDFTVEPGAKYRYRVSLILRNPLRDVPNRFLLDEVVEQKRRAETKAREAASRGDQQTERQAKLEWLYQQTPWSESTEVVSVPRDTQVLAVNVAPPLRLISEPSAQVMIIKWLQETGLEAYDEFTVRRGATANFPGQQFPPKAPEKGSKRDDTATALPGAIDEEETLGTPVDYITDSVVLDMYGGERLPGSDRTLTKPGRILVMDADFNIHVLDEIEDQKEYRRHKLGEQAVEEEDSDYAPPDEGFEGGLEFDEFDEL